MMNLVTLRQLEGAATPRPWFHVPMMLDRAGMPTLGGSNLAFLVTVRNVFPEALGVLEGVNELARRFNAVQATFQDGEPTDDTFQAQMNLQEALLATLQAHDILFAKMKEL